MTMAPDRAGAVDDAPSGGVGPACPRNWYLLAQSSELKPGAIVARPLGDIEIVLFRGRESGRAVAFAAHCAHAGCHLRHGKVVGDALRCALHHRAIRADGRFIAKDGSVLAGTPQSCFPVIERFDCIFVFAGGTATFDLPLPEICASGPVTTRVLPMQSFPLAWSTLISNGMDIDHLQAVHDRKMREPPTLRQIDANSLRLDYCAAVTGNHLSDRVMKWISNDEIRTSISCVGGSMMLVESKVGGRRTFVMLSMCPAGQTGSTVRAVVGVAGAPERPMAKISARLAAWLFHAFLKKDVGILQQMNWHAPDVELTQGDAFTRRLCNFFRSLPEFDETPAPSKPRTSMLATTPEARAPSLVVAAGRGA
jgi:phenylpropionate dioxygenase-like ring-hydroxylating dioxygenase large terminal subunit